MTTNKTCAECALLEVLAVDNGVTFYTCPYAEPEDACVVSPSWPACDHIEERTSSRDE